jgi:hypothetical protein
MYWSRALQDNVVGSVGNVIAWDHLHMERTSAELSTNPALREVITQVTNPRHELLISPGDAHEMIELKGNVSALTRRGKPIDGRRGTTQEQAIFSSLSLASVSVTMVGLGEEGRLGQTGHSTFDYDRMLKDKREDQFIDVSESAYRDASVGNVLRFYEFVIPYTRFNDDLPVYLSLLTP